MSCMRQLQRESGHWWFHLDLDVLSTAALATGRYRQRGGLSWDELATLIAAALRQPGLTGWDITIYNPDLDPDRCGAAQEYHRRSARTARGANVIKRQERACRILRSPTRTLVNISLSSKEATTGGDSSKVFSPTRVNWKLVSCG